MMAAKPVVPRVSVTAANCRKVLIAVDESVNSKRAFEYYIDEIAKSDDLLILLHIFNPPPPPAMSSKGKMSKMGIGMDDGSHPSFGHDLFLSDPKSKHWIVWRQSIEEKMGKIKKYLATFEDACKQKKIRCNVVLHTGEPGESICEMAEERNVCQIVIGSRGLNKIRRTFLGSVSDYVIHHSGKPVTLVPPPKGK